MDPKTSTNRTQRTVCAPVESPDAWSVEFVAGNGEVIHAKVVHVDGDFADCLRGVRVDQHLKFVLHSAFRIGSSEWTRVVVVLDTHNIIAIPKNHAVLVPKRSENMIEASIGYDRHVIVCKLIIYKVGLVKSDI